MTRSDTQIVAMQSAALDVIRRYRIARVLNEIRTGTCVTPVKVHLVADGPLLDAVLTKSVCPTCGQKFDDAPWRDARLKNTNARKGMERTMSETRKIRADTTMVNVDVQQAKFTPGPWKAKDYQVFAGFDNPAALRSICFTANNKNSRTETAAANAGLIAAAPDLYAACEHAAAVFENPDDFNARDDIDTLHRALAKARGEVAQKV